MSRTIGQIKKEMENLYQTKNNKFEDFPIGAKVKIITPYRDFCFFYEETGKVIRNDGSYLGIIVKLDEPRPFEDGSIQFEFNFKPEDICTIKQSEKVLKRLTEFNIVIE